MRKEEKVEIVVGSVFDTESEAGCISLSSPNQFGNFITRDSDGVECQFNIAMVK